MIIYEYLFNYFLEFVFIMFLTGIFFAIFKGLGDKLS
jgi:hypothetical protein